MEKTKQRKGLGNMSRRGSVIFRYSDFLSETTEKRGQWNDIFKALKPIKL